MERMEKGGGATSVVEEAHGARGTVKVRDGHGYRRKAEDFFDNVISKPKDIIVVGIVIGISHHNSARRPHIDRNKHKGQRKGGGKCLLKINLIERSKK